VLVCFAVRCLVPSVKVTTYILVICCHLLLVTFHVSCRWREMYIGHAHVCVCLCVCLSLATFPHYCTNPDVTWGNDRRCPVVVQYWADLQSVHRFCCYDKIARIVVNFYVLVVITAVVMLMTSSACTDVTGYRDIGAPVQTQVTVTELYNLVDWKQKTCKSVLWTCQLLSQWAKNTTGGAYDWMETWRVQSIIRGWIRSLVKIKN